MKVFTGSSNRPLAAEIVDYLNIDLGRCVLKPLQRRRDPLLHRRERPRRGHLHYSDGVLRRQLSSDGAVPDARRRQAGIGGAHHGGHPLLLLRPAGLERPSPGADLRPPRGRPHRKAGAGPRPDDGPSLAADPGVLFRSRGQPHLRARSSRANHRQPRPRRPDHRLARRRGRRPRQSTSPRGWTSSWRSSTSGGPAPNEAQVLNVIGDVKGRDVVLFDDMVDTAGTLVLSARGAQGGGRPPDPGGLHARGPVGPGHRKTREFADRKIDRHQYDSAHRKGERQLEDRRPVRGRALRRGDPPHQRGQLGELAVSLRRS